MSRFRPFFPRDLPRPLRLGKKDRSSSDSIPDKRSRKVPGCHFVKKRLAREGSPWAWLGLPPRRSTALGTKAATALPPSPPVHNNSRLYGEPKYEAGRAGLKTTRGALRSVGMRLMCASSLYDWFGLESGGLRPPPPLLGQRACRQLQSHPMSGNGLVDRARRACHVRARATVGKMQKSHRYESGAQRDWFPLALAGSTNRPGAPLLASIND
ncbi:hypothetical protein LY76DRAFT_17916 [Colletotrichum caudatum]|nr:hypothetical protein LY76DRAFT_17916 [Colletotrichum caudatum]